MTERGGVVVRSTGRDPLGNPCAVEFRDGVHEIERRIREGDELWRGDPSMELRVVVPMAPNVPPLAEPFQVWGRDAHGDWYLCLSATRCDHDILRRLTEADWQRGKENEIRLLLAGEAHRRERDAREREEDGEFIDRFHHALKRDLGHLGGGTRRLHGQVGGG